MPDAPEPCTVDGGSCGLTHGHPGPCAPSQAPYEREYKLTPAEAKTAARVRRYVDRLIESGEMTAGYCMECGGRDDIECACGDVCRCGHQRRAHFRGKHSCMVSSETETWACACFEYADTPGPELG